MDRLRPALVLASVLLASANPNSASGQTATAAASDLFREGSAAFKAGDLGTAHTDFARLVKLAPRVAAAHSALGAVLLVQEQLHPAIAELTEALRLDPNDTQAAINLAVAQSRAGAYPASVARFRALPPEVANSLEPAEILAYATALANTGEVAAAATRLRQGVAGFPAAPDLADALGALQAQQAAYDDARQSFARALQLNSGFAPAHAHLGSLLLLQGDPTAAIAELRRAIELGDTSPVAQLELGRAFSAAGDDAEALTTLERAATAQPNSLDVQYALALALQAAGDLQKALPLLTKVATVRPNDVTVLTNYGLALVQTGDAKAGLVQYTRAASLDPHNVTLHEDMGVAYLQTNDIDHALDQFKAGLTLDPDNPQLHYDLGLAYKLKDNLAAAIPELERAEALDPKLPDPPYTLGVIRMQQGKAGEATRQFQQAVALKPANGEAWGLLGSVQKDAGNLDAAADALRHAIALQPDQPSPHVTLAAILSTQGDRAGAAAERKIAADLSRKAMSQQRAGFALQSGRALLARGDLPGAVVQLNDAVAAEPNLKEAHLLLAEALQKQGRPADALAERRKAEQLSGKPQSP